MGAVFALFAGFYYWAPKVVGKTYNDFLGKIHFWTLFVGVLQIIKLLFTFIKQFIICVLSNSISEVVNREVIDSEVNDIDN